MNDSNGYSLRDYGMMVADARRTRPFAEAVRRAVKPGSVVLDIGTGTGFFAMLACRLGAARVYAIEPAPAILAAKRCAVVQPEYQKITWIRGLSTDLDLPERVDVVIGDLHGVLPFYPGNITSLVDARERHLKPGGTVIPRRDVLWAVPVYAPDEYVHAEDPWRKNEYGIDFSPIRNEIVNEWWRAESAPVPQERLLAEPQSWAEVDYRTVVSPNASEQVQFDVARDGTMHGYYVWFDGEMADGLGYSNSPLLPELVYGRGFFPLPKPVDVRTGDRLQATFGAHLVDAKYLMHWNTRLTDSQDVQKAAFRQSTFQARPLQVRDLARALPGHRPRLTAAGEIDLVVLQGLAAGDALDAIATRLIEGFPQRYHQPANAMRHVAKMAARYEADDGD